MSRDIVHAYLGVCIGSVSLCCRCPWCWRAAAHRRWPGLTGSRRAGCASYKHSKPYHPQTCGKVERFHQTMKKFLAKQP